MGPPIRASWESLVLSHSLVPAPTPVESPGKSVPFLRCPHLKCGSHSEGISVVESWRERTISKATPGPLHHAAESGPKELSCYKPFPCRSMTPSDSQTDGRAPVLTVYLFHVCACVHMHMLVHECMQRGLGSTPGVIKSCPPCF